MNAGVLTILKCAISLLSCGVFVWTTWNPSLFTISAALVPLLLIVFSFFVQLNSKKNRVAVLGAVLAALGFLLLNKPDEDSDFLAYAAVVLAMAPFFYAWLRGCCGKFNALLERKLHDFTEGSLFFYLCMFVAAVGLSAQLAFSFSPNIWLDESFSIALISHAWPEMMSIAATDVHPPLYYIILKTLIAILRPILPYTSVICIGKLVSVLPYMLLLLLAATKVRRTWGNYVGGLWGAALFASPSLISQGVEIRMYGWAMLFVTLAYLFAYDVITHARNRDWCCFALAGVAAAYTHYYACLAVTPVYLFLLYVSSRKGRVFLLRWLAAAFVTVVGYLPWLFIFLNQARKVSGDYWIPYPDLSEWCRYAVGVLGDSVTTGIVCLIILLQLILLCRGKECCMHRNYVLAGILCGVATLFVGLVATYLVRPVFVFRYMYPGLACFWLSLIIGAKETGTSFMKISFAMVLASVCIHQFLVFGLSEGKHAKECTRLAEVLNQCPDAVLITDTNSEQSTFSTLTGRTCLSFDKKESGEVMKKVYPACRQPNIDDIQTFLNQKTHPAYMVMLTDPAHRNDKDFLPRQYYVGTFFESVYFDMYVIPATENGAEH